MSDPAVPRCVISAINHVVCVQGESFAISGDDGNILPGGDHGFYVRDVRFLDHLDVRVNGGVVAPLAGRATTSGQALFHGYLPPSAPDTVDPNLVVIRTRRVAGGMAEELVVDNAGTFAQPLVVEVSVGTDFADIFDVRHGRNLPRAHASAHPSSVLLERGEGDEATLITLAVDDVPSRPVITIVAGGARAWLAMEVPARGRRHLRIDVAARGNFGTVDAVAADVAPGEPTPRSEPIATGPRLECSDQRVQALVGQSVQDLGGLAMPDPSHPGDRFAAAGSPWFLTLFGRDSLWAALMALPLDPDLALGTLRTLARRQGTTVDAESEEQPGKILHEVRHGALAERGDLPTTYYGSIDSTPMFVVVAHEVWRWGGDEEQLEALIEPIEAALSWMADHGDPDGDGFLEYLPPTGRGLANQGWKDSGDGIRFADGSIARAPLALAEVQGYAYAAATGGADLLEHFDRPGAGRWRDWAAALRTRFRDRFWVMDRAGPYPGVALDARKDLVDSAASNMGHLLFTGILDDDEADIVARRLVAPDMAGGFGLRTLSGRSGGYNPLSYHCGSVWPHDTAIAAWGMARAGHHHAAATLIDQLVSAARAFDDRLPELFAGLGREDTPDPVPYPSACRPQAWAAGSGLLMARSLLGLEPDIPNGVVRARAMQGRGVPRRLAWTDLPIGGRRIDLTMEDGAVEVTIRGADLRLELS